MAEQTVIVCDVCGKPATERITFKAGGRSLQKDLCEEHLTDLTKGARAAKRGRRPALGASAASTTPPRRRRKISIAKKPSTRRASTAKKASRRRPTTEKTTRSRGSAAKRPTRRRATSRAPEAAPKAS